MTFIEVIHIGLMSQIAISTGVIIFLFYASWSTPLRTSTFFTAVSYILKAVLIGTFIIHHWSMPLSWLCWIVWFAYVTGDTGLLIMLAFFIEHKATSSIPPLRLIELPSVRSLLKGENQGHPSGV